MDSGGSAGVPLGLVAALGEELVDEAPLGLVIGEEPARGGRNVAGREDADGAAVELEHELGALVEAELAAERRREHEAAAFAELNGIAHVGHIDSVARF
jgi:hypothetical protein